MSKVRIYRRKGESPNWQAQVYVGGKRYRFSCHTSDKSTARGFAEQRAAALVERNNRGLVGLPEPVQISKVFERYEREYAPKLRPHARRRSLIVFKQARAWFTNGPLYDPAVQLVTARDIQAFLEEKHSQGVCGRTVNLYRANLHRLFQLCVRPWLLIPSNPVDGTEPMLHDPREPLLLSQRDYERLRAATVEHPMLRLFLTLAWETGARSGELLQLEWGDVDFEQCIVTFVNDPARNRQTKGRRSRTVPISDAATTALRDHALQHRLLTPRSSYVFKHMRRNKSARPGDRLEGLYLAFKRAAKTIGLPTLRPHDLRHCFVTRKLAEGVPAQLVGRYVGHADLATTMKYTHLIPEHLRGVVATTTQGQM